MSTTAATPAHLKHLDIIPPPLEIGSPAADFEREWAYKRNNNNQANNNNNNSIATNANNSNAAVTNQKQSGTGINGNNGVVAQRQARGTPARSVTGPGSRSNIAKSTIATATATAAGKSHMLPPALDGFASNEATATATASRVQSVNNQSSSRLDSGRLDSGSTIADLNSALWSSHGNRGSDSVFRRDGASSVPRQQQQVCTHTSHTCIHVV